MPPSSAPPTNGHHPDQRRGGQERGGHGGVVAHIQQLHLDAGVFGGQAVQKRLVDIGGDHAGALGRAGQRAGPANALRRRGDEHCFTLQTPLTHAADSGLINLNMNNQFMYEAES